MDEMLSESELSAFFTSLNIIDKKLVSEIFDAMDTNFDGTVSKEGI